MNNQTQKKSKKAFFLDVFPILLSVTWILIFAVYNVVSIITGAKDASLALTLFKTFPTLVSPVVLMMIAKANRYGFLIGAINASLYGINYYIEGVYFSMCVALLISVPFELVGFFNWKRKEAKKREQNEQDKDGVTMQKLSLKGRLLLIPIIAAAWVLCYFLIGDLMPETKFKLLDTLVFVFTTLATIFMVTGHVEAQYVNVVSSSMNLVMWTLITVGNFTNVSYLVSSVYNVYVALRGSVIWTKKLKNKQE